jgi:phosphoglycolate phosphatase
MIETVVFDFDGTLAELHLDFELLQRQLSAIARTFYDGQPLPEPRPVLEWLDVLARELSVRCAQSAKELHSRGRLLLTAMEMDAAKKGKLFAFTKDILLFFAAENVKTGVITRNCTAAVKSVFPEIEEHCCFFLPREAVEKVKPDPEHLLAGLNSIGASPQNSLMIGDHPMDVQTAKNAGTWSAAVGSGNRTLSELAESEPDFLARDCLELIHELTNKGLLSCSKSKIFQAGL